MNWMMYPLKIEPNKCEKLSQIMIRHISFCTTKDFRNIPLTHHINSRLKLYTKETQRLYWRRWWGHDDHRNTAWPGKHYKNHGWCHRGKAYRGLGARTRPSSACTHHGTTVEYVDWVDDREWREHLHRWTTSWLIGEHRGVSATRQRDSQPSQIALTGISYKIGSGDLQLFVGDQRGEKETTTF